MFLAVFRRIFDSFHFIRYFRVREKITLQQEIDQTEESIRKSKSEIEVSLWQFLHDVFTVG